jgi:hypothetical protein
MLGKNYADLVLISIAGYSPEEMSFSADTGMGECLLVGRKTGGGSSRATFVILRERPAYPLLGATAARHVRRLIECGGLRRLEDGPVGGTALHFGSDVIGQAIDAPISENRVWNPTRIADLSLAQSAYQMATAKRIWLPTMQESEAISVPVATVQAIGEIGPYHADINFNTPGGGIRGPFVISDVQKNRIPTYPALWKHDASRETTLMFDADSEAQPRRGKSAKEKAIIDQRVAAIWATASHCHFNQNFQFNSQPTPMQFTPRQSIGGRAWISIRLKTADQEKALVAWGNTSLGFLLHWYHANKQQSGRGNIGRMALRDLPVLDVTALAPDRLKSAAMIFDDLKGEHLLPFHELDKDAVRQKLDERFAVEVLGLPVLFSRPGGPLELVRMKLAQEPSIRGGKATVVEDGCE